ncbi:carbohydrate kinase family protein [Pollutibacter soli]|uniref:carbohydrate kinase family protein n=1 Tax=Pollutibacter soli TaxID=3034157 RepID=UPI00301418D4
MAAKKSGIICAGILCADVLGKTIDQLPEKGKLSLVDKITLQVGGCAANVAISLAKIGLQPTIVGKIGDDSLGKFLLDTLQKDEVDTSGLKVDDAVSTSASMVMISTDGERSIIHSFGANSHFAFEDIDLGVVADAKVLLIAGTFLMPSFDGEGTRKLLKYAKEKGLICCMDTAWDSKGEWMKKIESSLEYLDWFMPSYDEAFELTNLRAPEDMAAVFFSKGVKNVIIKLNAEGCYVQEQGKEGFIVPSFNRVQAVDSSGAGDSFCSGFLTGLHEGWDVRKSARFANAVGAHCIMKIGTTAGIKSKEEILRFIEEYEAEIIA